MMAKLQLSVDSWCS